MTTKICIKCKEEKSIDEFYKRKDTPDGVLRVPVEFFRMWELQMDKAAAQRLTGKSGVDVSPPGPRGTVYDSLYTGMQFKLCVRQSVMAYRPVMAN